MNEIARYARETRHGAYNRENLKLVDSELLERLLAKENKTNTKKDLLNNLKNV